MKGEKLELVRGSGNVFRDLGRENAQRGSRKIHGRPVDVNFEPSRLACRG